MSDTTFHALPITRIQQETDQAVSVSFGVPDEHRKLFNYRAGQYLTLKFVIDGKEERRAYSMSSAPHEGELTVTVKRVNGGVVSNHMADRLKVGDTVDVMPPQGRFLLEPDPAARRRIYLFGAGSGITPLLSILKTVLEQEPKSEVFLFYGNRDEDNIIFKSTLEALEQTYSGQLHITHTLSRPKKYPVASGLGKLLGRKKPKWEGLTGRVDSAAATRFIQENPANSLSAEYFICGPGGMIDEVEARLLGNGVAAEHIHTERFVTANDVKAFDGESRGGDVKVNLGKETFTVTLKPGQSILDGIIESGKNPPYSCLAGACSTCMAKVNKGGVRMDVCYALDDDEVEEGFVLTCQSHPVTPEVEVDFDV